MLLGGIMKILKKLASTSLVVRILAGLVVGAILGLVIPIESLSQGNYIALLFWAVILGIALKRNPYPLILYCMKKSALTAFFTRSSAANIPVNMELCKDLGLNEEMYSVSIPLGSTINMDGAAVVITTLTLVAAHTTGVNVSLPMAIKRIKREKPRRRGASPFLKERMVMDALSDTCPACWVQSQRGAVPNMLSSTIRTNAMTCLILSIFSSPLFVCADLTILRFISLSNRLSDIRCTSVCTPEQRLKKRPILRLIAFYVLFVLSATRCRTESDLRLSDRPPL